MTNPLLNIDTAARKMSLPKGVLVVVGGSVLMTLAAKYQVPFYPVPMSLQTLAAIGLGFAFGPFLGVAAVLFYLAQGAVGLPVFANAPERGIGLMYMMGPTGGYLIGFVLAALVSGALSRIPGSARFPSALAISLLAGAVVYVPGLLWLGGLIGYKTSLLEAGLYPFILGDVVKAVIAAMVFTQGHVFFTQRKSGKS